MGHDTLFLQPTVEPKLNLKASYNEFSDDCRLVLVWLAGLSLSDLIIEGYGD
jgi:hypothetical protein